MLKYMTYWTDGSTRALHVASAARLFVPSLNQLLPNGFVSQLQKRWPLPNVCLMVTAEDQGTAEERIPLLMKTPAAIRGVSIEPMVGPIDLTKCEHPDYSIAANYLTGCDSRALCDAGVLNWVIVGGESGPKARPMHPAWVYALRDQCIASKVPFFFKQWGEWLPRIHATGEQLKHKGTKSGWVSINGNFHDGKDITHCKDDDENVIRVGRKVADLSVWGNEYKEMPK